jgi:hypothetical protein
MGKDTFYFSHDYNSRSDEKIKLLIRKHGILGYGVFWAIIEDLYNNANALRLDYEGIAYDLRIDVKIIESIINDFDLFVIKEGIFGSLSVERRLNQRNEKSTKARDSAKYRWDKFKNDANALQSQSEGNAIKESKGKEIKENESKINKSINIEFDVFWNLYDKKVSKQKVEQKWAKLKDIDRERIIETLPAFIAGIKDKQYQPHPDTYLNNRRWEDEETPKIPYINDGINHHDKNRYQSYVEYVEFCTIKKLPIIITEEEYYAK